MLDTVKTPQASRNGSSKAVDEINFDKGGTRPEALNKMAALGFTVKDMT